MTVTKGISIDSHILHKIEMPIAKIDGIYPACIRYPKSRIDHQHDGGLLILLIPPLLYIELFRSGILPSKLDGFYNKGAIYLLPWMSGHGCQASLSTFIKIKNLSRLPVYLYLIQRLFCPEQRSEVLFI